MGPVADKISVIVVVQKGNVGDPVLITDDSAWDYCVCALLYNRGLQTMAHRLDLIHCKMLAGPQLGSVVYPSCA